MKSAVVHPTGKIKYKPVADTTFKKSKATIIKITPSAIFNSDDNNIKKENGAIEIFPSSCGSCLFCNHPSHSSCENNIPIH